MSKTILVTGASGNVGSAVVRYLSQQGTAVNILTTTHRPENVTDTRRYFDFHQFKASQKAFDEVDAVFLMRPPEITDVEYFFEPLIAHFQSIKLQHVVFLSVQGAENYGFIPHAKIEKLLLKYNLPFTVVRPSYFMQNLTTTFLEGIRNHRQIVIPAGKAPFLWIDTDDIGAVIATALGAPEQHLGAYYTLTGNELLTFGEVADLLSKMLGEQVRYRSPNLLSFLWMQRRQGLKYGFIFVLILLHYLPRWQAPPEITTTVEQLLQRKPKSINEFIQRNKALFFSH